ncbi:hypothetical protein ACOSQ3_028501 [Xanthoceras sorbifolium]
MKIHILSSVNLPDNRGKTSTVTTDEGLKDGGSTGGWAGCDEATGADRQRQGVDLSLTNSGSVSLTNSLPFFV